MNIRQQFIKFVSQNILGMIALSCYILADTFFISVAGGADGITALNLALPVYGVFFAVGSLVGIGAATRFNILRNQKNEEAEYFFSNALFWLILASIPFVLVAICCPEWMIGIMGGDSAIQEMGRGYFRTFMAFAPFFMCNYIFTAYVRNDNDPGRAMVAVLVSSFMNIGMDYLLMFPGGMGMRGAALATGISPIISIGICCTHFMKKSNTIQFRWKAPSLRRLVQSCQLGISAFVGELSSAITTLVFNFLILGLVGNIGVAAYGVVANFALVAVAIFNGISQGSQPLLSQYYGRGEREHVKKLFRMGGSCAFVAAGLIILVIWSLTDPLVSVFNSEGSAALAEYAHSAIRLYFLGYVFAGFNIVATGYFGAVDQAKAAFIASILRGFVAIIGCACALAAILGLTGVWLSFVTAEGITFIVILILLRRQAQTSKLA